MLSRSRPINADDLAAVLKAQDSPHFRKLILALVGARRAIEVGGRSAASSQGIEELNVGHNIPFAKWLFPLLEERGFSGWKGWGGGWLRASERGSFTS